MENQFKKLISNKQVVNMMAVFAVMFGTFSANTQCICIFHDLEKPKSLDALKKF